MSPWDLKLAIRIDRTVEAPVYKQLEKQIADEIGRGRLMPGAALPGSRERPSSRTTRSLVVMYYGDQRKATPSFARHWQRCSMPTAALSVGNDNVCITRGSKMSIFVASRVLVSRGDAVAWMSSVTRPAFHAILERRGVQGYPDQDGCCRA